MAQTSLICEDVQFKSMDCRMGVLLVNNETLPDLKRMLRQNMAFNAEHAKSVKVNILNNGFYKEFIVYLNNQNGLIIDGYTRLSSVCELIESGYLSEVKIPFMYTDLRAESFNSCTRGTSAKDIGYIFDTTRSKGNRSGTRERAAEQAIIASMFLDVDKERSNLEKALNSGRTQYHTSKIVREQDMFRNAFLACVDIFNSNNLDPEKHSFYHWIAFFCRVPICNLTKIIASMNIHTNSGRNRIERYSVFMNMIEEYNKLTGL